MHPIIRRYYLITFKALGLIFKLTLIDQLTKWWFIGYLKAIPTRMVEVNDYLNIVYVWNYGVSFGMFSDHNQNANQFFVIFNIIVILYLFYLLLSSNNIRNFLGFNLIIGGAIGNLYDRIVRGAVFDFIDIHYDGMHFAVFNIADSFISIGAMVLIYDFYKSRQSDIIDPIAIEADKIRKLDAEISKNRKRRI